MIFQIIDSHTLTANHLQPIIGQLIVSLLAAAYFQQLSGYKPISARAAATFLHHVPLHNEFRRCTENRVGSHTRERR